ncbi:thiolase family protein [Ancylobacter sp. 6x-1]|uniref:Thiolase family protein n=1 Tax=Ancylobacter crimeensis TaxID=2579147 RepID=A0ABT0DFP8_9HYPH|nr:beta-ketoacyl synthase N-terminal-like domain-containing protein [Ancylobacter crimeensis]MCK0198699.1 thiolase family protein [Ancylobacter crimeensis]
MTRAVIVAARRTAVAPRRGGFAGIETHDLAAPVLRACLADAGLDPVQVDEVILGNALAGGGNVARLAGLAAGLPDAVPALTVDRQCCSGLDAIMLAVALIEAGMAQAILAGGVESWSRAPLRAVRPRGAEEAPVFYERPPFAPDPARDPDPLEAMAALAVRADITRIAQAGIAAASHARALAARQRLVREIVPLAGLDHDAFTRALTPRLSLRAPIVAGEGAHAIDATGVAVEADAAAAVLVLAEDLADRLGLNGCTVVAAVSTGSAPERPFEALERAALEALGGDASGCAVLEIMESTAVQFANSLAALGVEPERVNRGGGALSRGHPIGASGAILAVRLFHELLEPDLATGSFTIHTTPDGYASPPHPSLGLAAIAAAGGLGSALLIEPRR